MLIHSLRTADSRKSREQVFNFMCGLQPWVQSRGGQSSAGLRRCMLRPWPDTLISHLQGADKVKPKWFTWDDLTDRVACYSFLTVSKAWLVSKIPKTDIVNTNDKLYCFTIIILLSYYLIVLLLVNSLMRVQKYHRINWGCWQVTLSQLNEHYLFVWTFVSSSRWFKTAATTKANVK